MKYNHNTAKLIIVLIALFIMAVIIYSYLIYTKPGYANYKTLNTIESHVTTEYGSKDVTVDVTLTLKNPSFYDSDELEQVISRLILSADYDELTSSNSIEYLQGFIEDELLRLYDNMEEVEVIITSLSVGDTTFYE